MGTDDLDVERRKFLTAATTVIGAVGAGFASVPFIGSWLPSAKTEALGAPVEVDVSKIEEGQKVTVAWRGQPIFIIHRPASAIAKLSELNSELRDPLSKVQQQPNYVTSQLRSVQDKYLIVVAICTHLGCVPLYKPKAGSLDKTWAGGFFCPCHGSKFDFAGRVYKGVPAPTNLIVPPHRYVNENIVLIGEDP